MAPVGGWVLLGEVCAGDGLWVALALGVSLRRACGSGWGEPGENWLGGLMSVS